ncbi:MAG: HAD-IIA family hydrolase [Atopobiaceae bacterium]|nr:HAD-IIA family hydrolase [Atopobiaceae bacterium]
MLNTPLTDRFGKDASELRDKTLWLFDMDGTIYEDERVFDGTVDLLNTIRAQGGRYVFITNNSSKNVTDYVAKVNRMGIDADVEDFFTSVEATAQHLHKNHPGELVYCQGTKSLVAQLRDFGIDVTEEVDDRASVVLIGFDTELTMEKLRRTCIMLGKDVTYLATNPDLVCPTSFGFEPDCGSMAISLKNATGKMPVVIGKPEPTMVYRVMEKFETAPEKTVLVGDRLYTDIATAINADVTSICVLTGEATLADLEVTEFVPTYIFDSVREIDDLLIAE